MAKYSTGGVGEGSGGACELCGAESADLRTETVAGAELQVCSDCARHAEDDGDDRRRSSTGDDGRPDERERKRRAARNVARMEDARKGDPQTWEDGADYEDDPLPYLVRDYGGRLEAARQDAGLTAAELAAECDLDEDDVLAVEQGRATRAGVGGSVVTALEEHLDIELAEET